MFDLSVSPHLWIFAFVGVVVSWVKMNAHNRHIYGLSEIVDKLSFSKKTKSNIELIICVMLGCLISVGVTTPTNAPQALAAGLAWTGLLSVK